MKQKKLYNNKGFSSIDLSIALLIIVLFTSVVATMIYNINLSTTASGRKSMAVSYIIDMIEQIDNLSYEDTTQQNINIIIGALNLPTGYGLTATCTAYNQTEGNTDKLDLVKIINITVTYKLNNRDQVIQMSRLKTTQIEN